MSKLLGQPVETVEEFDALLEKYKLQNPEKFAAKQASGEFDRRRALLEHKPAEGKKEKVEKAEKSQPPKKEKVKEALPLTQ